MQTQKRSCGPDVLVLSEHHFLIKDNCVFEGWGVRRQVESVWGQAGLCGKHIYLLSHLTSSEAFSSAPDFSRVPSLGMRAIC